MPAFALPMLPMGSAGYAQGPAVPTPPSLYTTWPSPYYPWISARPAPTLSTLLPAGLDGYLPGPAGLASPHLHNAPTSLSSAGAWESTATTTFPSGLPATRPFAQAPPCFHNMAMPMGLNGSAHALAFPSQPPVYSTWTSLHSALGDPQPAGASLCPAEASTRAGALCGAGDRPRCIAGLAASTATVATATSTVSGIAFSNAAVPAASPSTARLPYSGENGFPSDHVRAREADTVMKRLRQVAAALAALDGDVIAALAACLEQKKLASCEATHRSRAAAALAASADRPAALLEQQSSLTAAAAPAAVQVYSAEVDASASASSWSALGTFVAARPLSTDEALLWTEATALCVGAPAAAPVPFSDAATTSAGILTSSADVSTHSRAATAARPIHTDEAALWTGATVLSSEAPAKVPVPSDAATTSAEASSASASAMEAVVRLGTPPGTPPWRDANSSHRDCEQIICEHRYMSLIQDAAQRLRWLPSAGAFPSNAGEQDRVVDNAVDYDAVDYDDVDDDDDAVNIDDNDDYDDEEEGEWEEEEEGDAAKEAYSCGEADSDDTSAEESGAWETNHHCPCALQTY